MNLIKIDLHVHSQDSSHTGSNISQESDLEKLLILTKKRVKIASFSDHDNFYIESYLKRLEIIKQYNIDITLWPGIEVNLRKYDGQIGQAIFIFDPDSNLKELNEVTKKEFRFNSNKYTYKDAVELFKKSNFNFMVFPHAGKGQDNMEWQDICNSQVDGLDITDFNNSNKKKILKQDPTIPVLYFSDTHTWRKYPQYGKFCSYVEVENKDQITFNEVKNNIRNNKVDYDKV